MRGLEILPVTDPATLDRFITLPSRLYARDPAFVAPLVLERREALSPAKNPYFQHAETQFWLAHRDGRDVGRISAQIDRLVADPEVGHFGMIAAEDDGEVFAALFAAAESWLRARGKRHILGPFNLSINEETGLLIDGFDTPPVMLMGHNPSYAAARIEALGYAKAKDLIAYMYDMDHELPRAARRKIDSRTAQALTVRHLDKSRYFEEFDTVTAIFNDAWAQNWGFIAFTKAEIAHMAKSMKMLIDPTCVAIVEMNGEAVGFGIALPNLNELIADFNGRLLPFNWLKVDDTGRLRVHFVLSLWLVGICRRRRSPKQLRVRDNTIWERQENVCGGRHAVQHDVHCRLHHAGLRRQLQHAQRLGHGVALAALQQRCSENSGC